MKQVKYSLFTAICMIAGIVIGSGIFFKADDILFYTNGNMVLGVLVFIVASIAIIFGSLAISQLAMRTDKPGGIVAYADEFINRKTACAFGWFQMLLYLPALASVVSWVSGMYICQLFGLPHSIETYSIIGFFMMTAFFLFNVLSSKLGGLFQNASMIIKLIPLIIIAVAGIFSTRSVEIMSSDLNIMKTSLATAPWITAFAPIAFSFDGWIISTNIAHEIKDSKKNLPLALTIAPIIVLVAYVLYFIGITSLLGPETVLTAGNNSVYLAAKQLFGHWGAKFILVFITVSVLGTLNGIILSFIRVPISLAQNDMIPFAEKIKKGSEQDASMTKMSACVAYVLCLIWFVINHITQKNGMNGDVSEIAICVSYLNYILLYGAVIALARKGEITSVWKGYIVPIMAMIGSLIIFSGSISNPLFIYYMMICYSIMIAAYLYQKKKQ